MKAKFAILLVGFLAAFGAAAVPFSPVLYGTVFTPGVGASTSLYTISTVTGLATIVPPGPIGPGLYTGLGSASNASMYAYVALTSSTGNFQQISPITGLPISTTLVVNNFFVEGGLDIASSSSTNPNVSAGFAYATSPQPDVLVRFALVGSPITPTTIGQTLDGTVSVRIDGLGFDSSDNLYGIGESTGQLYLVDTLDGHLTPQGFSLPFAGITSGLAFETGNAGNDELFAASAGTLFSFGTVGNFHSPVSIGLLGLTGSQQITGLTFLPPGPLGVPEPGTLALLGLALVGLGFSRRRKLN